MSRSLLSRIMPTLLAFYAIAAAAFFLYAVITFSATEYLSAMRWDVALKRAFILFMDYLIPVHAAAVAVAASRSAEEKEAAGAPPRPFSRVVSSAVAAFLVLTAVYAVLAEGVAPRTRSRLADLRYLSRVASEYRREATAAMQGGDWAAAREAIDRYLVVDPGNRQMIQNRLVAASRVTRPGAANAPGPSPAAVPAPDAAGAQADVEKARFYAGQSDWFSAHYYAQAAVALDPRRADALQIASQAENELAGLTRAQKDAAAAHLLTQKKDALDRLESGDALGAYYAFLALAQDNKNDADVARYLAEAAKEVQKESFFTDEARRVELLPGTQGILFFNRNDAESTEAVSIAKMVEMPGGDAWFFDIEAVRYDADGSVAWHFTAPYGRREGEAILMDAVDRTDARNRVLPLLLEGTRPAAERAILRLQPSVEELRALSSGRTALAGMSVPEMWRLRARLGAYGLARQSLNVEMSMRLVMPFAFLILSVLCTALGWSLRMRSGERLPALGVVLLPLLPVTMAVLSLLYLHAHRLIVGFLVIGFGLATAMIVVAVLQVVLLAVALALLAGQSSR
ncbi:MAG TPA: hypothetical protein VFI08_13130 [Spirochaetia bacterium]|nr:hypothetical protein [Spirochaetia bacterium]